MRSKDSSVALSLRQPWVWLILHAGKTIENRKWNTKFRGTFYVHAAKTMTRDDYADAQRASNAIDLAIELPSFEDLQLGGIVGRARLVDVVPPCSTTAYPWHVPEQHGFVLVDVEPLPFVSLRGMPGFFPVDPSEWATT